MYSLNLRTDPRQLLAELQLAFILFINVNNFSSLEIYKSIISLLCRSKDVLLPPTPNSSTIGLSLYSDLLTILQAQLSSLREGFFDLDLPELDTFLIAELTFLRDSLRSVNKRWSNAQQWTSFTSHWSKFADYAGEKFGWDLKSLEKPLPSGKLHYDLLKEGVESDEEL